MDRGTLGTLQTSTGHRPGEWSGSATFSGCRRYRYSLTRVFKEEEGPTLLFIMLNPSTADASQNDPTIRRCMGFAVDWGFSRLEIGNIFAYQATHPRALASVGDPVGPDNDDALVEMAHRADMIVVAWGGWTGARDRAATVQSHFRGKALYCLGVTKSAQPAHPLYLPKGRRPLAMV